MPRQYKRKTERTIDENNAKIALRAFFTKEYSMREAARRYGIKRSTLQSRIKILRKRRTDDELRRKFEDSGNESDEDEPPVNKYGNKYTVTQVFTLEQEKELEKYIQVSSDLHYGLDYVQLQKLAYQYAIKLPNCKIPDSWVKNQQAGE